MTALIKKKRHSIHIFDYPEDVSVIISIDNLFLGPALGGTRMRHYTSKEDAILDVKQLSHAMTFKSAIHGLNQGGGKCVIYNPKSLTFNEITPFFIDAINALHGDFIAGNDMGISVEMLNKIHQESPYLFNRHGNALDPSIFTAESAFLCIEYIQSNILKKAKSDVTIKVQGLGHTGNALCQLLLDANYQVQGFDIVQTTLKPFLGHPSFTPLNKETWFETKCDIFSPCAAGGVITSKTIHNLNCSVICGIANNPCDSYATISQLNTKNILYIPDFISNGGGVIYASGIYHGQSVANIRKKIHSISQLLESLDLKSSNIPYDTAVKIIHQRLSES